MGGYLRLPSRDYEESKDLVAVECIDDSQGLMWQRVIERRRVWLIALVIAGTNIVTAITTVLLLTSPSLKTSGHSVFMPSPIENAVNRTPFMYTYELPFLGLNIYREDPSPEVDAAWDDLGASIENVLVSPQDALQAGVKPEQVHLDRDHGGGYIVHTEATHDVHCLDALRRALYWNFPYYRDNKLKGYDDDQERLKFHTTHCLDFIRQRLMCAADSGLIGSSWYRLHDGSVKGIPDFGYSRVCRNYTEVLEWTKSHLIDPENYQWTVRPDGNESWIKGWQ